MRGNDDDGQYDEQAGEHLANVRSGGDVAIAHRGHGLLGISTVHAAAVIAPIRVYVPRTCGVYVSVVGCGCGCECGVHVRVGVRAGVGVSAVCMCVWCGASYHNNVIYPDMEIFVVVIQPFDHLHERWQEANIRNN